MRSAYRLFLRAGGRGFLVFQISMVLTMLLGAPGYGLARIYIDINAPSMQKFKLAVPDFKDLEGRGEHPELAEKLARVISNDLDLSGYFKPMDKGAFLDQGNSGLTLDSIRFRDWTVIGADLLVKGGYACIGRSLEVEMRLFDVFRGQQIDL